MQIGSSFRLRLLCLIAVSTICAIACGLLAVPLALAQAQGAARILPKATALPRFEVASVRLSGPGQREANGLYTYPGGRVVGKGCQLQYLIMMAYNVQDWQVSGGPAWASMPFGERFDIQAKPPEDSPAARANPASPKLPPGDEERQMLQSLLADRFQLRVHRETRTGTVYILTKGRGELKLSAPKDNNAYPWAGGIPDGFFNGGLRGQNISMPEFAVRLSGWLSRPVVDRTGLQGSFDFEYQTGEDPDNSVERTGALMTAVKGIGLKLKSGKGPVEIIVIDHVEKPTEN